MLIECEKIERGIGVEWSGVYFMIIYYYCKTLGGIIVVYVTYKIFILKDRSMKLGEI